MFLIPAYALVVAAPAGPDQGCPSPRQITEALNARVADLVGPAEGGPNPGGLRLVVTGGIPPEPVKIELIGQNGETRLQRNLTPTPRERGNDCPALAETVALIVDRYLHEVGYDLPLPPPPPVAAPEPRPEGRLDAQPAPEVVARPPPAPALPVGNRFDLLAAGDWRGASDGNELEADLGLGLEGTLGARRTGVALTGGIAPSHSAALTGGTATLRRFPLHLALFLALPVGPGWLEPGAGLGVDWLMTSVQWARDSSSFVRVSPAADLALGYRVTLARGVFLRGTASANLAVPYRFVPPPAAGAPAGSPAPSPVFTTPRTYIKSGLELGFSFQ